MSGKGMTFAAALKELFREAELQVPVFEPQRNAAYRYPHAEGRPTEEVYRYLESRKLSRRTVDRANLGADDKGEMAFLYYDQDDQLLTVKYRPAHKVVKGGQQSKCWCQSGASTTPLLWNMNRVNPELHTLAITEGELDTLALLEAGFPNAVSVPFGASSLTWIDHNFEWLSQFDEIILCGDRDEPGQKMNAEVMKRLGAHRCKTLQIPESYLEGETGRQHPVKDCNEILYWFGRDYLLRLLANAQEAPIDAVSDLSDVSYIDVADLPGVKTGIAPLDREIGKLYFGSLTLITGTAGSGKSSLLTQILARVMDAGYPIFVASLELPEYQTKTWFNTILAGETHITDCSAQDGTPYYRVDPDAIAAINRHYRNQWFVYRSAFDNDIDSLLEASMALYRRKGVRCFLYDNLLTIDAAGEDELAQQAAIIKKLLKFSQDTNSIVALVAHPRKVQAGMKLTLSDVSGSSKLVNLCHVAISLRRYSEEEKQKQSTPYDVVATVLKNRFTGMQGHELPMWYSRRSRRFYTSRGELNYRYSWDQSGQAAKVPWPHGDEAEVFGTAALSAS